MKTKFTYIAILATIFLTGCTVLNHEITNQKTTLKGEYKVGKGCNGLINEVEIKTSCEEQQEYSGKIIEVTGVITDSECTPEFPQCRVGKEINNIESMRIVR